MRGGLSSIQTIQTRDLRVWDLGLAFSASCVENTAFAGHRFECLGLTALGFGFLPASVEEDGLCGIPICLGEVEFAEPQAGKRISVGHAHLPRRRNV